MAPDPHHLREEVLAALAEGVDAAWPEARYNRLALRVFAHQYERNAPYRRFCEARGVTPEGASDWRAIPAVPTAAFKSAPLCAFPPEEAAVVYLTSGTSLPGRRGRHYLRDTALYDASLTPNLEAHLFPDVERIRIAVLAARPEDAPESSLAHMLGVAVERWGAPGSRFYLAAGQLDLDRLLDELTRAEAAGEPVCLMGAAFAFVHLIDRCATEGRRFQLPAGSRIMDTGGYKGRSREVPKEALYRAYGEWLGVPDTYVVNEYGMTEMSSQFYDTVLRDFVVRSRGNPAGGGRASSALRESSGTLRGDPGDLGGVVGPRRKVLPPWVRTLVVDSETLEALPPGRAGLLRHFDLANVDSVTAIQTDDFGVCLDGGFEILGRAAGAEPRGCSLGVEEALGSLRRAG